jgi:hypothetical protein
MSANTPLQIHEFSDGITPKGDKDNWISGGYTGSWMNSTLSQIPQNVQRSIANEEYKIGVQSSVAIIGRVVRGDGINTTDWSVIAVTTPARDEVRREFPLYRYFLAEGADSLSKIVGWLDFRDKQGRMPIFNPFESKVVGESNPSAASIVKTNVTTEMVAWLQNSSNPELLAPTQASQYPFPVIDRLAHEKAKYNDLPLSWAFNVEALEKPERFQIILPASDRGFTLIQQKLANMSSEPSGSQIDEKALKQVIKGLSENPSVKPEHWRIFLANISDIPSTFSDVGKATSYWHKIFDGQGASNAIKQGIYTQPMIRLLTLRAIILPETLSELLQWLQVDVQKNGKSGSYAETSMEFQKQLFDFAQDPLIKESLMRGTRDLVANVLDKAVTPESAAYLFSSDRGIWGQHKKQLRNDFRHDLEFLGKQARNIRTNGDFIIKDKVWDSIWAEMQSNWRNSPRYSDEKYSPLAEFFYRLGDRLIAACFYQLSYGQVPSSIFVEAFPNSKRRGRENLHGLLIKRKGYDERGRRIMPIPIVAAIAFATFVLGMGGGLLIGKVTTSPETKTDTVAVNKLLKGDPTKIPIKPDVIIPESSAGIDSSILTKGIGEFRKTKESLKSIVSQIRKETKQDDETIKQNVKDVLDDRSIEFSTIESNIPSDPGQQDWVKAVFSYQSRNNLQADGIIDKVGKTYTRLLNDVRQRTVSPSTDNHGF